MRFSKIALRVDEDNLREFRAFLLTLGEAKSALKVKRSAMPKVKNAFLVTLNLDAEFHEEVLTKLNSNNLTPLSSDELNIILAEKFKYSSHDTSEKLTEEERRYIMEYVQKIKKEVRLDDLVSEGRYEELIKISRNIQNSPHIISKAKLGLPTAINNAISKFQKKGLSNEGIAFRCVEDLLKIAADPTIKSMKMQEVQIKAGIAAIEICTNYPDFADDLVKIANNHKLHNSVNIRSAIEFAKIIFSNIEAHRLDIKYALKEMNIRWLRMIYGSVQSDFSHPDRDEFNNLIKFIEEERLKN